MWTLLVVLTVIAFWLGRNGMPAFVARDSFQNGELISGDELIGEKTEDGEEEKFFITVHIAGAVNKPGVYNLQEEARVIDGIIAAGGEKEEAYLDGVNLARTLLDGEQIVIPEKDMYNSGQMSGITKSEPAVHPEVKNRYLSSDKININRADISSLSTLRGIGEVKAADIISYREEHGQFSSAEELLLIKGIGEATYANIKDKVTVR